MSAQLMPSPRQVFYDANGAALAGGQLFSYEAGTTTPLATYTDASGGTPNANPVILDTNGSAFIWIGTAAYKFVLQDSLGNTIWTQDNVSTINPNSITESMLAPLSVGTPELIAQSVTTAKIQPLAITTALIAAKAVTATQIADGAVGTSQLASTSVTYPKLDSSVYQNLIVGRNRLINGMFNLQNRTAASGSLATNTYMTDRWVYTKTGTMVNTASVSTTNMPSVASAGRFFSASLGVACTTAEASLGTSDFAMISQRVEWPNFYSLYQRAMSLSFWVYATKTGVYCVVLRNVHNTSCYVAEYTVAAASTWQKVTISIPAAPSGWTLVTTNTTGLEVGFVLAGGTALQTTPGAWTSGSYICTSNQVNSVDTTAETFSITAVQLEAGSIPTDFDERLLQQELDLASRHWETVRGYFFAYNPNVLASKAIGGAISYTVPKANQNPTAALLGGSSVTSNCTNIAVFTASADSVSVSADFPTGSAASAYFGCAVTIDAELYS